MGSARRNHMILLLDIAEEFPAFSLLLGLLMSSDNCGCQIFQPADFTPTTRARQGPLQTLFGSRWPQPFARPPVSIVGNVLDWERSMTSPSPCEKRKASEAVLVYSEPSSTICYALNMRRYTRWRYRAENVLNPELNMELNIILNLTVTTKMLGFLFKETRCVFFFLKQHFLNWGLAEVISTCCLYC